MFHRNFLNDNIGPNDNYLNDNIDHDFYNKLNEPIYFYMYNNNSNYYLNNLLDKKLNINYTENSEIESEDCNKINCEDNFVTYNKSNEQIGGNEDLDDIVLDKIEENVDEEGEELVKTDEEDIGEILEEELDEIIEEEFNLDELVKLYDEENVVDNKTVERTSKLISEAINDTKWEKHINEITTKYDKTLDLLSYDSKLEDIFHKYYIYDEYIFKDDTIKTLRNKIAVSIPLSDKFHKETKLLPEMQYFWSEYYNEKGQDNVMLGQKWVSRNELLKIDIKPNDNIKIYENLLGNLSYLKDSFGYKIKRDDDENNIIRYYDTFMTLNEIFMLDLFNDLGLNNPTENEIKKILFKVHLIILFQ